MSAAPSPYSLLKRLTFAFAAVAGLVFSLTGAYLYRSLSAELQRRDDIEISGKLNQFAQLSRARGSAQAICTNPGMFHDVLLSHPGVYLGIYDARGTPLVEHADGPDPALKPLADGPHPDSQPFTCAPKAIGQARCIFSKVVLPSGEAIRMLLVRAAEDRQSLLDSYRDHIWFAIAAGALLVCALGHAVTRRGLLPVRDIGRQASRIEAHNLDERLDIRGGPVELHELALSVNRMLDRLERSFERLSRFSSDLAHDMRTPLANIISASQITLSRARSAEEYEALIDSNIEECERLQRMIDSMLFLARTDNAQQHLTLAALDAADELQRLASYFQGLAEDAGVRIVVHGRGNVHADAPLFRRAVSNLVSNALQHAHRGSTIELAVSVGADHAAVSVANQGAVIAPDQLDRIFERFYRVDASRHGSARNAGLGLAIVKSIMALHRGSVAVTSDAQRTIFTLRFPCGDSRRA
ncbi:histidine kinase [Burkholderia stagnalis]|uniref:heavy metal sensor histidine kinase n=1 Tax=Burkholderia stagnalis TaxID=1503054 RepID=UPI000759C58D|nr:heavy metal sensor histidine kinase [Burkholderia stagnalis]KVD96404.1 histidine kinase [Burkholderia stagnalis]